MKIEFDSITDINAGFKGRSELCLKAHINMTEVQEEKLFYELWAKNGDKWLMQLLKLEGYDLINLETKLAL